MHNGMNDFICCAYEAVSRNEVRLFLYLSQCYKEPIVKQQNKLLMWSLGLTKNSQKLSQSCFMDGLTLNVLNFGQFTLEM